MAGNVPKHYHFCFKSMHINKMSPKYWDFTKIHQYLVDFTVLRPKMRFGRKWPPNTYENSKEYLVFWHRAPSARFFGKICAIRGNN